MRPHWLARRTTFNRPLSAQQSETKLNLKRRELNGSSEFTTWVALAGAAILAGLTAIYSSSPFLLIAAALIGAYLGYKGEQLGRAYVERRLARNRLR
jgi:fatty acid desaturase